VDVMEMSNRLATEFLTVQAEFHAHWDPTGSKGKG
jgi:hypothetical protein